MPRPSIARPRPMPAALFALATSIAIVLTAGCGGDDSSSAKAQACTARNDVRQSVTAVGDDVKAGNFGQARDDLAKVRTSLQALTTAHENLKAQERAALQPQIDDLHTAVDSVGDATSLSDLQSKLNNARSKLNDLTTAIGTSLSCK